MARREDRPLEENNGTAARAEAIDGLAEAFVRSAAWTKWAVLFDYIGGNHGATENALRVGEIVAEIEGNEPVSRQAAQKWRVKPPAHVVESVAKYAAKNGLVPPHTLWSGFCHTPDYTKYVEWIEADWFASAEEGELLELFRNTDRRGRDAIMAIARSQRDFMRNL